MKKFCSILDNIYNSYVEYEGKTYFIRSKNDYNIFMEMCKKEIQDNHLIEVFGVPSLLKVIKKNLKPSHGIIRKRKLIIEE